MAFGSFSSLFLALCSSSDVAVYLTSSFLVSLHVYTRQAFICLAYTVYKQLSRKATLMFQDLIPSYFHLNQLRNSPTKTYRSVKKRITLSQRPGGQYAFFRTSQQPISVPHDQKTTQPIDKTMCAVQGVLKYKSKYKRLLYCQYTRNCQCTKLFQPFIFRIQ